MRKFFVTLIFLIVAAGAAFYFGWVQFQLPADSYGVIFTKTGGFESNVVKPGSFVWRWQRLLPTNLTLYVYHLTPQHTQITSQGTLPSGSLYAQYLQGKPSFSYKIAISVAYVLKPNALPKLMVQDNLTPKTLDAWYADFTKRLTADAQSYISSEAAKGTSVEGQFGALSGGLAKQLEGSFPEVRFTVVAPETVDLPDLALYQKAKQQYLAIVAAEQQTRKSAAVNKTNLDAQAAQKIELLKKYGELFNKYPVLLKYLDLSPAKRQNVIPGF